jgi:alanine racemase
MQQPTTWIELSQSALSHNIATYKRIIGNSALMAVVKSDAYGHGLIPISLMCQANDTIAGFIVVSLTEAIVLRECGITKPIVVMGYLDADLASLITYDIQVSVTDDAMLVKSR